MMERMMIHGLGEERKRSKYQNYDSKINLILIKLVINFFVVMWW